MGLFDKLKGKKPKSNTVESVSEEEKQYYAEDDYYKKTAFEGTAFEREVITFDEWKKRSYPSKNGLYVPEVLLLQYCEYGNYPHPANGYPGLWWYQYGIRDVTAALKQLEERGFICFGSPSASLKRLKVPELKDLLTKKGCSVNGKKADLIERVSENYTDQELMDNGIEPKYILTALGEKELQENEYIPFMHSFKGTTVANCQNEFNVWSINRALKGTETDNWKDVVISEYNRTHSGTDPIDYMFRADTEYKVKGDLDKYIAFWEKLWSTGKIDIDLPYWIFMLPELYMKQGRYDEALAFTNKVNQLYENEYSDAANEMIQRIEKEKGKA